MLLPKISKNVNVVKAKRQGQKPRDQGLHLQVQGHRFCTLGFSWLRPVLKDYIAGNS